MRGFSSCLSLQFVCSVSYDEKSYLSQVLLGMLDSLQKDSTKCAPQYEFKRIVTMATYWVPDLPNIKGYSGHL